MTKLLEIAIKASLAAGSRIKEIYDNEDIEIEVKGDNSPLTKADLASHHIIIDFLKDTNIPILSEEGKDLPYEQRKRWPQLWIVDPLDGTKEFIKKNGEFTVNIALVEDQIPILGVIYVPVLNQLYFAEKQIGSFKLKNISRFSGLEKIWENAEKLPLPIHKQNYTVVASKSHMSAETEENITQIEKQFGKVERLSKGSSLKFCLVAEGSADCYPRFGPTMEWDTAAGHAICKYAGKSVTDLKTGKEMVYNRENLLNNWFVVN